MMLNEMCELISKANFLKVRGMPATPLQIFNYSPTGELFKIWEWYEFAVILLLVELSVKTDDMYIGEI
jgi:hypothetical protein